MNPKYEAIKLIKKYSTNNPFELADNLNIYYRIKNLGNLKGVYFYASKNKVILINSSLDYYDKLIVFSHELGHAIMHPKTNCKFLKNYTLFLTDKIEIEANTFCANLLLPNIQDYEGYTIEAISAATHIPIEIVKLR